MKYMGSKARIAKHILPIILKDRSEGQWYVEPFVGGANMIDKVDGNRIGGEYNKYIALMWQSLVCGWTPAILDKDMYKDIRDNKGNYPPDMVGWAGVACSYSGKWFGGFAGQVSTKGGIRDYQAEAHKNLKTQINSLLDVKFIHSSYDELAIPANSIIYCDPPYKDTTKYKDDFNHEEFWQWCRDKTLEKASGITNINILRCIKGTHQEIYDLEQFLHMELRDRGFEYQTDWGSVECFDLDSLKLTYKLIEEELRGSNNTLEGNLL